MRYFLTILFSLLAYKGDSCTCIITGEYTVKIALAETDIVFVGTTLSKKTVIDLDKEFVETVKRVERDSVKLNSMLRTLTRTGKLTEVTFLKKIVYKGNPTTDTIKLITPYEDDDACGYNFTIDSSYIVYASTGERHNYNDSSFKKFLHTTTCTRTRLTSDLNEIKELEKYTHIKKRKHP